MFIYNILLNLQNIHNAVKDAEDFLTGTLGTHCEGQESHTRVEEILMALKAVGNAKRPTNLFDTILRCAQKASHANITRAAFDAIRGFPALNIGQKIFYKL